MTINTEALNHIEKNLEAYPKTKLLIVTKNQNFDDIDHLISRGYSLFGENRVQEAAKKYSNFNKNQYSLHLIGPLQTNKVKQALSLFDTIQSIDRLKLVHEIVKQINTSDTTHRTKSFFIQVNIGEEEQKSGVDPKNVMEFYILCKKNNLNIEGLMCIPPNDDMPEIYFDKMKKIRDSINTNLKLSMGMSNDYEISLRYDANIVRIGSKIFL